MLTQNWQTSPRDYPSHLLLPITKGNRVGTFYSGGKPGGV